ATNTLTGIAGAFADNIPVLLLMGQHPLRNLGKEYQQEFPSSKFDNFVKAQEDQDHISDCGYDPMRSSLRVWYAAF
ncbi:MAG: hypothetical protein IH840_14555, partial [Candidatus Heimdallarchaeota archaeon]|nr:hypothetical protein [Candidatus Heimdallarchaeota archaeon]